MMLLISLDQRGCTGEEKWIHTGIVKAFVGDSTGDLSE